MRFSKQRQIFLDILLESNDHLTADQIFQRAQEKDTNISVATVYRNLNQLEGRGLINKVNRLSTVSLYDGNIEPHDHLHCRKCLRLYDIPKKEVPNIIDQVAFNTGHTIEQAEIIFSGLCQTCKAEEMKS